VKSNGRQTIRISSLPVLEIELLGARTAALVCVHCRTWQMARGGLVQVHAVDGNKVTRGNADRCAGSGQHLTFDVSAAEHITARAAEVRARRRAVAKAPAHVVTPTLRRVTAVRTLAYPPAAPAVHQIAARRART
jgi:hypothetical protein